MASEKVFEFTAAVRGYHYYRRVWVPKEREELDCLYEPDKAFDVFAIKTVNQNGITTGHLPREISRTTIFLLDRGAKVSAQLSSKHYHRSPLVQDGLEISCYITAKLPGTIRNQILMDRYKEIVE